MDNNRMLIIGAFACLALSGSYVLWGPAPKSKRKRNDLVPGLQNVGNSCFLNAVLQALASWSFLLSWLNVIAKRNGNSAPYSLVNALHQSLKDLNTWDKSEFYSPSGVIEALHAKRWVITSEEQDAHELFHVLTTTLEEESSACIGISSLLEPSKLETNDSVQVCQKWGIINRFGYIQPALYRYECPTRGLLASQLKCKTCGYKYPVCYDNFDSISLVIPNPHWGHLRLQDCLKKYISCELVHDVNCDGCRHKKDATTETEWPSPCKSTFIKQLTIGKLPHCLCFHVQRTVWLSNGIPIKCSDHVSFPEFLSMDDYIYQGSQKKTAENAFHLSNRLIGGCHTDSNRMKSVGDTVRIKETMIDAFRRHSISNPQSSQETRTWPVEKYSTFSGTTYSTSFGKQSHLYILKAVIVHLGSAFSGHFIAYRRSPLNQARWFYVSDTTVQEVKFSEVLQSSAYMLFYERIS